MTDKPFNPTKIVRCDGHPWDGRQVEVEGPNDVWRDHFIVRNSKNRLASFHSHSLRDIPREPLRVKLQLRINDIRRLNSGEVAAVIVGQTLCDKTRFHFHVADLEIPAEVVDRAEKEANGC